MRSASNSKPEVLETGVSAASVANAPHGAAGNAGGTLSPTPAASASPGSSSESAPPLMLSTGLVPPRPRLRAHAGFRSMSYDAYDRLPALRRSDADKMAISAAYMKHCQANCDIDSTALTVGRVLHTLILEPQKETATVAIWKGARRFGKEWDAFKVASDGKDIVTADEYEMVSAMRDTFLGKALTRNLLKGASVEGVAVWTDPATGIELKARLDIYKPGAVFDLKSTSTQTKEDFLRDAYKFGYHRQAAWYLDAARAVTGQAFDEFFIVAIEKKAPFDLSVYRVDQSMIALGRAENAQNIALYATCLASDVWPGRPEIVEQLTLPGWVK
jgi:hypothetical protein